MFAAFLLSFPDRGYSGGVRMEGVHQLGQFDPGGSCVCAVLVQLVVLKLLLLAADAS